MTSRSPLPRRDRAASPCPQDEVSATTWHWAQRALPAYLLGHSVRAYCWGAAIAAGEGWTFDRQVLWTASLMHDYGLTRIRRNTMCFEVEGAEIARRFLERAGLDADAADRAAIAIILHMRPAVTLADGVEIRPARSRDGPRRPRRRLSSSLTRSGRPSSRSFRAGRSIATSCGRSSARSRSARAARASACSTTIELAGWMARSPWRAAAARD